MIEFVRDGMSIDAIKGKNPDISLNEFFTGSYDSLSELKKAKYSFAYSLAGYSLVTFILQVKDRHNGNLIITQDGHIVHIDFGFIFTSSPAKNMNFEKSPFKLTLEFVEILEGTESEFFKAFRQSMIE